MTVPDPQRPPSAATPWLTVAEAAIRARRVRQTVRRALEVGDLDGHQTRRGGRWQIHIDAVDAWVRGKPITTQRQICGCVHLQAVKTRTA
ncbi:MAG: helix-turn-helix domain-containing protein [Sciscionella sp.]